MKHDPWSLMRHVFCKLFCPCDHRKRPTVRVRVRFGAFEASFEGKGFTMVLPDNKQVSASVAFVDVKGNPAQVQGAPVWATDRPDLLSVVAADDGMSATVSPVGPLGSGQVTVTADADLGDGVVEIVAFGQVDVIASQAVAGNISFGEPA